MSESESSEQQQESSDSEASDSEAEIESCLAQPSSTLRIEQSRILSLRPPRAYHERTSQMFYQGRRIDLQTAVSTLERALEPDRSEPAVSRQCLNYAMFQMQNAITKSDEAKAISREWKDKGNTPVLSSHVRLNRKKLPIKLREGVELQLNHLWDFQEIHLTEAEFAGLLNSTPQFVTDLNYRILNMEEVDMALLMDVTWMRSTPQLARGLDLF